MAEFIFWGAQENILSFFGATSLCVYRRWAPSVITHAEATLGASLLVFTQSRAYRLVNSDHSNGAHHAPRNYKNDNERRCAAAAGARSFRLCSLFLLLAHNASLQLLFEKSRGNNFCSSVAQSSSFIIILTRAVIISDVLSLIVANFCISPRVKDRARTYVCVPRRMA